MADISVEEKSSGKLTLVWMAAAVLSVAGLMFWLYGQSQELEALEAVEAETAAAEEEAVQFSDVAGNPASFAGQTVQLDDVTVGGVVGPRAFFGRAAASDSFLIVLGQSVQTVEMPVAGEVYQVVGAVLPVTDSLVGDWAQTGVVSAEAQAEVAGLSHYLLADSASTAAGAAASDTAAADTASADTAAAAANQ